MDAVWSLYNIGTGCHEIAQVVFWVEFPVQRRLCPIFVKSRVLGKGDSIEWCRVTRHPQIFRRLTGCQRTPGIWVVTYYDMTDLLDQLALTKSNELKACGAYIACKEEQRLVQFLIALCSDFEGLRGSILHRSSLPSVHLVVSELLSEKTRLKSHS